MFLPNLHREALLSILIQIFQMKKERRRNVQNLLIDRKKIPELLDGIQRTNLTRILEDDDPEDLRIEARNENFKLLPPPQHGVNFQALTQIVSQI